MSDSASVEICVLGGGPAGSCVAQRLAELGHEVWLIEQSPFPRPHIGESLTPAILPLLDQLELREVMEKAGFRRPHQAIIHWGGESRLKTYEGEPGLQVDRGRFDQLLLESARDAGVEILQPVRVTSAIRLDAGGWQLSLSQEGRTERLQCEYLIDASGQSSVVANKRKRLGVATLALYGYWKHSGMTGPESRVEAGDNLWFWSASLPDNLVNACVFVDPKACAGIGRAHLEGFYRQQLQRSSLLAPCLSGTLVYNPLVDNPLIDSPIVDSPMGTLNHRPTGPITACSASAGYSESPVSEDLIRVGDACVTLDPISSQGVQSAISMALQAAVVVHTQLSLPERRELAAEFYRQRQQETITRHQRWASRFYTEQAAVTASEFWQVRAAGHETDGASDLSAQPETAPLPRSTQLMLHPAVSVIALPILKGDLITPAKALSHPDLERPIAFVEHIELVPLIELLTPGDTLEIIVEKWSHRIPAQRSLHLLNWLWQHRLIQRGSGY